MPELHAAFGGSTASRTMNCPGWRQLADTQPHQGSSSFADRGTLLHNAMELIFRDDVKPESVIGMVYNDITLTEELYHEKIVPACNAVDEIFKAYGITEWGCEEKVTLADDAWGTCDVIGAGEVWSLVLDYKFGDGIQVSPVENDQFLFYGSGAYHTKDTADLFDDRTKAVFAVVQPNARGADYSVWETTTARLRDYREPFLARVEEAKGVEPKTCAGDHCKFCPAIAVCPQKTGAAHRAQLLNPKDLETIRESLKLANELETWITAVRKTAHEQLEVGAALRGWKLVLKRATREWVDEDKAIKYLARKLGGRKSVVVEKAITPAQAEKLAKTAKVVLSVDAMIESKSSGSTLAPADDKRPAIIGGAAMEAALASVH
jgi:hypothetical protein